MELKYPDQATAPVVGLAERWETGNIGKHSHKRAQLIYAISGLMTVTTKSDSWVLPPTRALWVPGGVEHSMKVCRSIELRTLYVAEGYKPISLGAQCRVINISGLVNEIVLRLVAADWNYSKETAEARLGHVLGDQLRLVKQEPVNLTELRDPRARRFAMYFYDNPAERRSIKTLAHMAGISPRTLARVFKRETGMSINGWCRQLRLLTALEKIAGGSNISDAAYEVGYENPSSFIAVFNNTFGTTPGRYFQNT